MGHLICVTPECGAKRGPVLLFCLDCTLAIPRKLRGEITTLNKTMESEASQAKWPVLRAKQASQLEIARRCRANQKAQQMSYADAKVR